MNIFPAVDPIPIPAPVWLFKALHIVTLALHFVSVEMLLGGLLVATWLNFLGARGGHNPASALRLNTSSSLARRMPVVMTYVINLGVPPLLFAQVLYGPALYTSSVLIGVYWIAVIFLLMACYWLLYRFAAASEAGRAGWWLGLGAWLIAGVIARIYSTNMTLMLRPEVWGTMYSNTAMGIHLPPVDATLTPRWLFMLAGGFTIAGLWLVWLSGRKSLEDSVRSHLATIGGRLAVVMGIVQVAVAFWVLREQPEAVRTGLADYPFYQVAGYAWLIVMVLVLLVGTWTGFGKARAGQASWLCLALGVAAMLSMTTYRDGIRDVTLLSKGFDVWQRTVVTNWSVVGLFLITFVAGLGGVAWLLSVVMRAKPVSEKVV